eukprot:1148859-Pelagomonas_calceolata.AAC.3
MSSAEKREYIFMDWKPQLGSRIHLVPLDGSLPFMFDTAAACGISSAFAWKYKRGGAMKRCASCQKMLA